MQRYGEDVEMMKLDAARQEPLVAVIAAMLEETVKRNERSGKTSTMTSFHGLRPPPLGAAAFVSRIAKYSGASPCCFAVGLIYLERMKKRDVGVCLTPANFQRLFLTAVMCASKFLDDFYYSNKHWAEVGGIQTTELNKLELEFLFRMGFSLHMQREEYDWYAEELHSRVPRSEPMQEAAQVPEQDYRTHSSRAANMQDGEGAARHDVESSLSASTTPNSSSGPLQPRGSKGQAARNNLDFANDPVESGLGPRHQISQEMDFVYC
jgi:hypothetical protein